MGRRARWLPRLHARIILGAIAAVVAVPAFLVQPARAEIVLRSVSSTSNGSGATSITINKPAGVAVGDVMIASVAMRSATGLTVPSGWTSLRWDNTTGNTLQQHLLYRVATSADVSASSYNFSWSVSERAAGAILAYSGVDTASPIQGHNGTALSATFVSGANTITTTAANSRVVGLFSFSYPSTVSSVSPTSAVKQYETISSGGGQAGAKILVTGADRILASASASGQTQVTVADTADTVAQHVALNPSSSAVTFQQAGYRWFQNQDNIAPGAPLAAQDTSASVTSGSNFRLRQILKTTGSPLNALNGSFKLQYAAKSGVCDVAFSGETYSDVQFKSYGTATQGAGSAVEDAASLGTAWTQPARAAGSNDQYATVNGPLGNTGYSKIIKTTNFGFSIPVGATIQAVTIGVEGNASGGGTNTRWDSIQLLVNGTPTGSTYTGPSQPSFSDTVQEISVSPGTLTATDVNSTTFGVQLNAILHNAVTLSLDDVTIKIEYAGPPTSVIRYADNASVTNNAGISSTVNDPTSGGVAKYQRYIEDNKNPFTNSTDLLNSDDALWDFSLVHDGVTAGTYCFRMTDGSGAVLSSYATIPEITIGAPPPTGPTLTQQMRGGQAVVDGVKTPFSW